MMISLLLSAVPIGTYAFTVPSNPNPAFGGSIHFHQNFKEQTSFPLHSTSSDKGENDNDRIDGITDNEIFESLRKRQNEIAAQIQGLEQRWCNADCRTTVPLQLDDWVRRIALDKWPIVAVGTANGSVRVADLITGKELAIAMDAHAPVGGEPEFLDTMFGKYDGGGVIAVAMHDNILVSAGREGGIKIWRFNAEEETLIPQGQPSSLDGIQVSSIKFDDNGDLWVGSFDNKLRKFELDATSSILKMTKPVIIDVNSGVTSIAVNNDIGLCVCGLADGTLHFISTSGDKLSSWNPFDNCCARSVGIIEKDMDTYDVVCGGADGSMYMRPLSLNADNEISMYPFCTSTEPVQLHPKHGGAVVDIATRKGGIFVSGAHDGSLRIWDCRDYEELPLTKSSRSPARAMYHLIGYKVWLGSICIDESGLRLFSDGSDNSIVLHDFSSSDE